MNWNELRIETLEANRAVVEAGLVLLTWGNVSVRHATEPVMAIKPSGVAYDELSPDSMVIVSIETGDVVAGELRPSSDTATHLELYRAFPSAGAVVHTHSTNAVAFAQAHRDIPIFGTTHADHFRDAVPVTREMTPDEVADDYEGNTGRVIVETFGTRGIDAADVPGVLVASHGPFAWGKSAVGAVENAIVLEECARMALATSAINPSVSRAPLYLTEKHFLRKHGSGAYYGQGPR